MPVSHPENYDFAHAEFGQLPDSSDMGASVEAAAWEATLGAAMQLEWELRGQDNNDELQDN